MVEIVNADGNGKLVVRGAGLESLEIEVLSGSQRGLIRGLTKTRVEKMRNRAFNAAKAFPKDMPDANILYHKGETELTISTIKDDLADGQAYTESRDGEAVLQLEASATGLLKRPQALYFVVLDNADASFSIEADCTVFQELADALSPYLN